MNQKTDNPNKKSKSNTLRSIIFFLLALLLCSALVSSLFGRNANIEEVPLSEVISRANTEDSDIAKITVKGSVLEITTKGSEWPTQTSRKDASGTLYDQGLVDKCASLVGDELKNCREKYPTIEYVEDIEC